MAISTEPVEADVVGRYVELGLRLGRHLDGLVDAYYGPADLASRIDAEPARPLPALVEDARRLVADLDAGAGDLDARRRAWLRAQAAGLHTVGRKLGGEDIGYADEVESCYGVRPQAVPEDDLAAAHRRLDDVLPGSGALADRLIAWREAHAVPVDKLDEAIRSLADDFRERTDALFGLPEGEHVDFMFETDKPWAGFNYYLGGLRSRVAINVDLPVLSTSLGHLVAHEAYPGHHTEHSRKEVGLVRRRDQQEEAIFLVGTPQCLLAEGLADLGLEVLVGARPEPVLAEHLRPLGIRYDAEVVAAVATAAEALAAVRGNVALLLNEDGADAEVAVAYLERWALLPRNRAEKAVEFLTDPTWRAYISCYVEGLPLCREFVAGDPARFQRLLSEQLIPSDLVPPVL
ncbi:MAG: DUF885 domain-containing protein [Actinomycetota bacterium]|nr:DUF885 domain-containing protein [Actinomycetota bacterium]